MIIKGECSECYKSIDVDSSQKTVTCPECGLVHEIVFIPRLQPKRNQPSNKPYSKQQTRAERRSDELAKLLSLN